MYSERNIYYVDAGRTTWTIDSEKLMISHNPMNKWMDTHCVIGRAARMNEKKNE